MLRSMFANGTSSLVGAACAVLAAVLLLSAFVLRSRLRSAMRAEPTRRGASFVFRHPTEWRDFWLLLLAVQVCVTTLVRRSDLLFLVRVVPTICIVLSEWIRAGRSEIEVDAHGVVVRRAFGRPITMAWRDVVHSHFSAFTNHVTLRDCHGAVLRMPRLMHGFCHVPAIVKPVAPRDAWENFVVAAELRL